MSRIPSQATLVLHIAGVTVTDVARAARIAQPSVSAQFAGRRLLQDRTLDAIGQLAGVATAEQVQAAAARARAKYLLEVQAGRM